MTNLLLLAAGGLALVLVPWFGLMALIVIAAIGGRLASRGLPGLLGPGDATQSRFLFVIPAHDEATVIGITVRSCREVDFDPERFQVCVIADNCTDATAEVAREAGALVWVRTDLARKSKGFALEDFFATVATNPTIRPPDAFVLVDADTSVGPDILRAFDRSLARGDDFVQGYYTVRNADASWRTRLMTYAFSLANGVWLVGLDRLGLGVGLKGNGMCFRANALRRFPWQAAGLVEDMEFAWKLRVGGERVRFNPLARVFGEMVSRGGAGAASQRQRWEGGRQALRASFRPAISRSTELSWIQKILYRIDLEFPPLGRLAVGLIVASMLAVGGWLASGRSSPPVAVLVVCAIEWAILLSYVASPILVVGLPIRYVASLAYVPVYLVWKVSISLWRTPQQWVRTPRETPLSESSIH